MIQFCARWAGKIQVESDLAAEHPPVPVRIGRTLGIAEMWCREVGKISTSWMADDTSARYFQMAAKLFPAEKRTFWAHQFAWLRSGEGERYRDQVWRASERLRTGAA